MKDSAKNIAVIGAGIMGLSAAYALRGHNVSVFDAGGFPAKNASAMAGGMLAPWSEIEYMPGNFHEAALEGIRLWQENFPTLVQQSGSLIVTHKDDEYILERLSAKLPQFPMIEIANIAALEPALGQRFAQGLFLPGEAHLDPQQIFTALIEKLPQRFEQTVVPHELRGKFDVVIDCRGMGAESNERDLRGVKGEIIFVRNPEFTLTRPVRLAHPRYPLYIVPRPDNMFVIGATIIESTDNTVTLKSAMELLSAAYSLHPSFAEAQIVDIRAGIRPAYPDNLPRISVEGNIIRCNGLFRHGYLLAPVMAAAVADYVAHRENKFISLFMKGENHAADHQRTEKKHRQRA